MGRIKHLGFSSHGRVDLLKRFLDICGDDMEFCQIQLNYLDWTLQDAKAKYDLLTQRGIAVWVMEPVRGGKLVNLKGTDAQKLKDLRPDESVAAWGFRFLQGLPNVKMILSGMSNMEQLRDNIHTFEERKPLNSAETQVVFDIAEGLKNTIPCTACRYCVDGCPMGLDIPTYISVLNDLRFAPITNSAMMIEFAPEDKKPSACIACGKCAKICPQNIDIPAAMKELTETVAKIPSWREVCRQREEEQKKLNLYIVVYLRTPSVGEGHAPPANVRQLSNKSDENCCIFGKTNSSFPSGGRAGHDPPLQLDIPNGALNYNFSHYNISSPNVQL